MSEKRNWFRFVISEFGGERLEMRGPRLRRNVQTLKTNLEMRYQISVIRCQSSKVG